MARRGCWTDYSDENHSDQSFESPLSHLSRKHLNSRISCHIASRSTYTFTEFNSLPPPFSTSSVRVRVHTCNLRRCSNARSSITDVLCYPWPTSFINSAAISFPAAVIRVWPVFHGLRQRPTSIQLFHHPKCRRMHRWHRSHVQRLMFDRGFLPPIRQELTRNSEYLTLSPWILMRLPLCPLKLAS